MRNPERINKFCNQLKSIWMLMPDMRFGQIMFAINNYIETCEEKDPFYIEDKEMMEYIKSTFLHKLSVGGEHNL